MKMIFLTRNKVALVDDDLYPFLNRLKWQAWWNNGNWYARCELKSNGRRWSFLMHRLVIGAPDGMDIDHKNQNGLHNYRANLRVCSRSENMANSRKYRVGISGFKGVTWHKQDSLWQAQIHVNYKHVLLGLFRDPREAARAYDRAAVEHFGVFACTNAKLGLLPQA